MQTAVVVHTSPTQAYNAAQECLPRQHKLIYRESVSLKRNDITRKAEELLMQAPSSQPCPAERTLDAALADFVQQTPGLPSGHRARNKAHAAARQRGHDDSTRDKSSDGQVSSPVWKPFAAKTAVYCTKDFDRGCQAVRSALCIRPYHKMQSEGILSILQHLLQEQSG